MVAFVVPAALPCGDHFANLTGGRRRGAVTGISLFDEFRPTGAVAGLAEMKKSLAFRVVMQDTQKATLTDAEADATREILAAVAATKSTGRDCGPNENNDKFWGYTASSSRFFGANV